MTTLNPLVNGKVKGVKSESNKLIVDISDTGKDTIEVTKDGREWLELNNNNNGLKILGDTNIEYEGGEINSDGLDTDNIKFGTSILGTEGGFSAIYSNLAAGSEDIKEDKIAFVNGEQVVGTLKTVDGVKLNRNQLTVDLDIANVSDVKVKIDSVYKSVLVSKYSGGMKLDLTKENVYPNYYIYLNSESQATIYVDGVEYTLTPKN